MDNPGEIMRLCRLCLVKDQVNIPIFDEQGDIRQIFLKISSCLPVKVSKEDQLPKSICDGCSNKLDLLYEFRNSSVNAEKALLSWVSQAIKDVDETVGVATQPVAKPSETQVKEETLEECHAPLVHSNDSMDAQESAAFDENSAKEESDEPPPPKRARRTAAVKAQINIAPDSDDEDDDDLDIDAEPLTKIEDESDESDGDEKDDPSYPDVPGTSADDQPGPSGVGKDGVEAPTSALKNKIRAARTMFPCRKCTVCKVFVPNNKPHNHILFHKAKIKMKDDQNSNVSHSKTESKSTLAICDICNKSFPRKDALTIHKERNHLDKSQRVHYPCDICGQVFLEKSKVNVHIKRAHLKQFKYQCDQCGKGCMYLGELNTHVKGVHNKEVNIVACTYESCNKVFTTQGALKYHLHTHSEDKPTLVCDQCGKIFNHPTNYKRHQRKHHQGMQEKYKCQVCHKEVTTQSSLKGHMRVHSGERPFVCEHCGKSFRTKQILQAHLVVHTKAKRFICRVCAKAFTQRSPLKAHMMKMHPEVTTS